MSGSIEIKLFLGFLIAGELGQHLFQCPGWTKQEWLNESPLTKVCYQEKNYAGLYIANAPSLAQIKQLEEEIKTQLQLYCPKLNLDKQIPYVFPQIFLS